ncbi:MAG: hypothetical protein NXI04_05015 [Planctomycetaceae bacterium]|nr:hypothetical protein [Planctomycetaceae bacterium]
MAQTIAEVPREYVSLDGETYFRISDSHLMPEFFMSLVGASDHWMFVSSYGALTAGRCDPDNALFPYASDDQLSVARSATGSTTLIRVHYEDADIWQPFAAHAAGTDAVRRFLYKTPLGDRLVFEEVHESLGLTFRYQWAFSEKFGFVRSCRLENTGDQSRSLELLDGLQNVLPYGVGSDFMMRFSNLANAYKKSERLAGSSLGLFYLSSIPTDRAEPSEGLKATTVWQTGLTPEAVLLSTEQLAAFRHGADITSESVVRGRAGAYLVKQSLQLAPGESREWQVVAELAQDHTNVINLDSWLKSTADPHQAVRADVDGGRRDFLKIVSSADALQCGANPRRANRHLSNTVFNVMRGGIPLNDYEIDANDFRSHVRSFNAQAWDRVQAQLQDLPEPLTVAALREAAYATNDYDLIRLTTEYLPLAFSRRHGDPTRPWNRFAIHLRSENGRTNLDYQGNWRDIFQNWEALAVSFPEFSPAMICRFLNATTADGYNPYRVTKGGFEWEEPSPEDPWANIGYWGDHQIIYLLKLLEWNRRADPDGLSSLLKLPAFVHADVPYRILPFEQIRQDPHATIEFDAAHSQTISTRVEQLGADGKLLRNQADAIHRVTLLEKLLTLSLAKLSNFIPDGGIWLNTQRPEWNDANNALVGYGLSMVTTCYLHRWFCFLDSWLTEHADDSCRVSEEVATLFQQIHDALHASAATAEQRRTAAQRLEIVTALSSAGSDYRQRLYTDGVSGRTVELTVAQCRSLFDVARRHLETTIRNNRRDDGLYHAYNLLRDTGDGMGVEYLYEMLEGQVAVLSAGVLSATEVVNLLDALRASRLYRENQDSYMLYPDRTLPGFLARNNVDDTTVTSSELLQLLLQEGNEDIVSRDVRGGVHFNGRFRNCADLKQALLDLPDRYRDAAAAESEALVQQFEELFDHRQFTGRSGTFFAYEGLGSIYWHMVSKLGLAVSENFFAAVERGESSDTIDALRHHFQAVRRGIGAEKTPTEYGAFPSDPYSHTPENAGVKQPGMTGQVKEDILSRFAEVGVHIEGGCLHFRPQLFDRNELLTEPREFSFCGLNGQPQTIDVPAGAFAFTICQVPVVLHLGAENTIRVQQASGTTIVEGLSLDRDTSRQLFSRSGQITMIACQFVDAGGR